MEEFSAAGQRIGTKPNLMEERMQAKRQVAQDSESRFPSEFPSSNLAHSMEEPFGRSFETLLSEANEQLATVLQDYLNLPYHAIGDAAHTSHINELLTRAVLCAVKQHILQTQLNLMLLTGEFTNL
jgi:hypothetical protein